jgi:hypothetical protein
MFYKIFFREFAKNKKARAKNERAFSIFENFAALIFENARAVYP